MKSALIIAALCTWFITCFVVEVEAVHIRPPDKSKYKIILDVLEDKYTGRNEKTLPTEIQSCIRTVRRWRQKGLQIEVISKQKNPLTNQTEKRIVIDGKILLHKGDLAQHTSSALHKAKGSGAKKLTTRLDNEYKGINYKSVLRTLKTLPDSQANKPIFDNRAPSKPIRAEFIQQRHQVDLVTFEKMPVYHNGKIYKYVLSILDVFSRYLWLRPLEDKSSAKIAKLLEEIYNTEGPPLILQCDNGKEFQGAVTILCKKLKIKVICSRPYHPQSQGKVESSHQSWKKKIYYDMRKQENTNWAESLQKYCRIRNEEHHDSLGMSPFEVYHGRKSHSLGFCVKKSATEKSKTIRCHLNEQESIRKRAKKQSDRAADRIIEKNIRTRPPSIYEIGEKVLVKHSNIRGAIKRKRISTASTGIVIKRNLKLHTYKIKTEDGSIKWFPVTDIAALSRQADLEKRAKIPIRTNIFKPICNCIESTCSKMPSPGCSFGMNKVCCRKDKENRCRIPSHNIIDIEEFILGQNYGKWSHVLEGLSRIQRMFIKNKQRASDELTRNALMYNLVPSATEIPKDGNCLFHSIASALTRIDRREYNQEDVRRRVANYLRQNPYLPNGDSLEDFVLNRNWGEYLDGVEGDEWGDHIAILAASSVFDIRIMIISSQDSRILEITPQRNNNNEQNFNDRTIYLGHEFEVHYILLDNIAPFQEYPRNNDNKFDESNKRSHSNQSEHDHIGDSDQEKDADIEEELEEDDINNDDDDMTTSGNEPRESGNESDESRMRVSESEESIESGNESEESRIRGSESEEPRESWNESEESRKSWNESEESRESWNEREESSIRGSESEEQRESWNESEELRDSWNGSEESRKSWNECQESRESWNGSEKSRESGNESEESRKSWNESEESRESWNGSERSRIRGSENEEPRESENESGESRKSWNESESEESRESGKESEESRKNGNVSEGSKESCNESEESRLRRNETEETRESGNESERSEERRKQNEDVIELRNQVEVMRRRNRRNCPTPEGEALPREIQYLIIHLALRQNPSSRYILRQVNSFFRQVIHQVPTPRIYLTVSLFTSPVPTPISVRRLVRVAGRNSGLVVALREIITDSSWINAWLFLNEVDNRWFEINNIRWTNRFNSEYHFLRRI